jgi:hypothetical protein
MRSTGRTLTAGFLVLTGTGFLALSGAGIAHAELAAAKPAHAKPAPAACTELITATKAYSALLAANKAKFAHDLPAYVAAVDHYGNEVKKITSTGSPALRRAAKIYVTDLETETADLTINPARLNADSNRLTVLACTPSGAPRTGGGSSAAMQDPGLFGAGGAAVLAGLIVVGLTVRGRPRTSADQG